MKKSLGAKTIIYPTPVLIVASYDADNNPNAMNAAWGGICSSNPPCVNVSLRKARKTYSNILEKKAFTINIPSAQYVKEADYFGMVSGKNTNKFEDTGLTPVKSEFVDAPYIKEFPLVLECKLFQVIELGMHTQFIGEVMDVKIEDFAVDGAKPDIKQLNPLLYTPELSSYWTIGEKAGDAFSVGGIFKK